MSTPAEKAAPRLANNKPIALRLTSQERADAFRRASAEGRSAANFARQMYLIGLRHYQRQQARAGRG